MLENLWSFNYRKGPAPLSSIVRAKDEREAIAVARAWCERQEGCRFVGAVRPMIVADATILGLPSGPAEVGEPVGAVAATTAPSNSGLLNRVLGR